MSFINYLKIQIECKRKQMMISANKSGYTSKETIRYSQELDELMNMYRRANLPTLNVRNSGLVKEKSVTYV